MNTRPFRPGGQPPIRLSLIRTFELRCGDDIVQIAPGSQRLIGFLALQGRSVRRSYASGALWSDVSESRANASMRSALWRVPTASRTGIVRASTSHIWLNPDVTVDLTRMATTATAVLDDRAADAGLVATARELCAVGDDLLAGWYDDWVIVERERFRQLRLHALDQLGERLLARRHYSDALQVGLAAVAAEPLRESAHRLLVRVHLQEGNAAEAVRQYRTYARILAEELNVRPSPAIEALVRDYLGSPGSPRQRHSPGSPAPHLPASAGRIVRDRPVGAPAR